MTMIQLLVIYLTIFIWSCECDSGFVSPERQAWCMNENYRMSLFSTRYFDLKINRTLLDQHQIVSVRTRASIADRKVIHFVDSSETITEDINLKNLDHNLANGSLAVINFQVRADYMNSTRIHYLIKMIASNGHVISVNCSSVVLVSQPQRLIDKIFKASIPFLIGTFMILMGILLDLEILKEIFLQPIPVVIGFVCQYTLMPLIAYGITKIFKYPPLYGLGLFVVGCCPGGAVSNQWTVMFDGDLNLSAFMSFASTVAAFFMMPFWFYTLGQYAYLRRMKIHIPFLSLALSLLRVIVPLGVGMILVYFIPKLKLITKRIIKPALFLLISYFLVFGSIVNIYLFQYVDLKIALTAPLLPWFGYILGGIAAWLLKQDWKRVKTIGIETGIQNIGVAFMVLLYSFPAPQNTQATVVPLIVAYLTAQPFYIVLLCRVIRRKCFNKKTIEEKISADKSSETTRHSSDSEEVDKTTKVPLSSTSIDTKPTEI